MKNTTSIQRIKNAILTDIALAKGNKENENDYIIETAQHFGITISSPSKDKNVRYCIIDNAKVLAEITEQEIEEFLK